MSGKAYEIPVCACECMCLCVKVRIMTLRGPMHVYARSLSVRIIQSRQNHDALFIEGKHEGLDFCFLFLWSLCILACSVCLVFYKKRSK